MSDPIAPLRRIAEEIDASVSEALARGDTAPEMAQLADARRASVEAFRDSGNRRREWAFEVNQHGRRVAAFVLHGTQEEAFVDAVAIAHEYVPDGDVEVVATRHDVLGDSMPWWVGEIVWPFVGIALWVAASFGIAWLIGGGT